MKQLLLLHTLILLPWSVLGQQNLVPNGSFEEVVTCPDFNGSLMHSYSENWITPGVGSPDLFHGCGLYEHQTPPSVIYGNQWPRSGDAFVGMFCFTAHQPQGREYMQVKLKEPLNAGVRYHVSFYVSLSELSRYAISSLGAHLSHEPLTQSEYWVIDVEPQIQNPAGNIIADTSGWVLVTDTFRTRAGGGEEWLAIGNFNYAADSDTFTFQPSNPDMGGSFRSYYYIDDVSVVALDSVPNSITELQEEDDDFLVYPNPNAGSFTLSYELDEFETGTLQVYDMVGKLVFAQDLSNEENAVELTIPKLKSGVYIAHVDVNGQSRFSERISILK